MLIQVHDHQKPAFRGRTIAVSIGLLAISTGLAASLTWDAKGTRAGYVIVPRGWSVSVRPPPGAVARAVRPDSGSGFRLDFLTSAGAPARMWMLRLEPTDGIDLLTAAEGVLFSLWQPRPHAVGNLPIVWHDKTLGDHDAVEIWDPEARRVVRVGKVESGEFYAVVFGPTGIDPDVYDVFDRFCHSIEDR